MSKPNRYEPLAWLVTLTVTATFVWATYKMVTKITEPCPPATVTCPHQALP